MAAPAKSLLHRLTPYISSRIRHNSRLLSSSFSSSQPKESPPDSQPLDSIHMTHNCIKRMKELQADEDKQKMLRLSIEAGGCSGFQYNFSLENKINHDDRIFEQDGVKLVVDNISFDFVNGATVDYVEELIRSAFQVSLNPSAVGGCSCKSSFMVKQ